ncbi:unnamed protein product [Adineta steineri]|uniref:Uncharacterized protein n=1 Tax=Adineta steineri TaxID=433720 RepID=A0A816DM66_9BILA|nr:unnamed protein product [Adineta steineri]CAF1638966.1 unnamed protein product [Adineta steineri]
MRKLSLDRVYGCSTAYRHSIIGLPDNRVAFLAGSYLVILDCLTNEQRYISFSSIEYLYISSSGLLMGIIDRFTQNGESRIHIYSTKPIDLLFTIEPDRFGSFIGITINTNDNILMILHSEPAYMITIQEIQTEYNEQQRFNMIDLGSVRAVHGSVINRMTKKEIIPHVAYISFCPYSSTIFCATGSALFKIYEIDNQNVNQKMIHFRAEFYIFTCHCWLDVNSILTATDHGHIFWIQDGSIRSDISLEESITIDLHFLKNNTLNENSGSPSIVSPTKSLEILNEDLFINDNNLTIMNEKQMDSSIRSDKISEEIVLYLDLFTSTEILPNFIVSFREYIFVFTPVTVEPFFQIIARYRLQKTTDSEIHNIHKMSYIFDNNSSFIYLLTDRNQIFRYKINQLNPTIELEEKYIYGFHAYNILSIGLCTHKPWLITLGSDNWIKIFDYKDKDRQIVSKYIPDGAYAIAGSDPYGFHICLAMNNRFQLYLITNYELRLVHQYETRNIRDLEMSQSGHFIAVITNNLIKVYSTIHFNLISQLRGHVGKIKQIIWCKNDSILISCGTDGMIYMFNIFTGMRENEIITKQFRYVGITVTNDCNRIYAITSDSTIKIFHNTNLEQEWSIENNFLPSAICLSKSERLLYVGMTHGIIRIYTIPFTNDSYIDLPAHCSSIRRLLVSYDDEYLVSIAESAYLLLFKQTRNNLNSVSSQYQFSQMSLKNFEIINESKPIQPMFEYILVTKSEFDEQKRKIKEIQARINEFETENNLKLRSKYISFTNNLNTYSNKFQTTMKQLISTYEQLKSEIANNNDQFSQQTNGIEEKYDALQNHAEVIYENKMIEILSNIQNSQVELKKIQIEYKNKQIDFNDKEHIDLNEIIDKVNLTLQSKWQSAVHDFEIIQEKEYEIDEYIRQMEIDIDDEIENVKINYENELKFLNEYVRRLTINVSTHRKRYNGIIARMETRDVERNDVENEVTELYNRQSELIQKLDHFHFIIKKKEDRIGVHDIKIHRLQQHILHVEKRKYVLDYKTKSLLERIEPMDQEIKGLKTNNQNIEQQLTILKQQQNNLIRRENQYEFKLNQSYKQLSLAKINHQHIWKIVKRQKEAIKKAFEFVEISCELDTMNVSREQLKKFIQNMCNTMENEQQTENQLEIQGFMKEWNNQRKWLLNQLQNLTKYTEENKQRFVNIQRDHRKVIAPFINQLRELHNLFDEIQKKIQKRLALLKIKTNDQREFLQNISDILHEHDRFHIIIDKLCQNELHIEIQDKEIDRLASIIFRYQYSTPCLELNQIKSIHENNLTRSTIPSTSIRLSTNK